MIRFLSEPKESAYKSLLDMAFKVCSRFILVERHQFTLSDNGKELLDLLKPFLIEIKVQQEWPATKLLHHYANVYYYTVCDEAKELLIRYSTGLYSWLDPNLPEDLCFFKDESVVWLTSIAHEEDSWIDNLTDDEANTIISIEGLEYEILP